MDAKSDERDQGEVLYTPGPWTAHEHGGDWYVFSDQAMVADGELDEPWITRMRGIGRGATVAEQRANAELIAQAPDLARELAAARERVKALEGECERLRVRVAGQTERCSLTQDALDEARGRTESERHAKEALAEAAREIVPEAFVEGYLAALDDYHDSHASAQKAWDESEAKRSRDAALRAASAGTSRVLPPEPPDGHPV